MKLKLNQIMVGGFNDQILSDLRDIYGEFGEEVLAVNSTMSMEMKLVKRNLVKCQLMLM